VHTGPLEVVAALALLLVFMMAASWLSVLVGVLVSEPDKVQIFGFMVIFPLSFTSNAFVPTDQMPGWLQAWVKINPVTILADAVRGLLSTGAEAGPIVKSLLWAVGIVVVFAPLAVRALKRRV
jgi:oleandomycin transport system permease protein